MAQPSQPIFSSDPEKSEESAVSDPARPMADEVEAVTTGLANSLFAGLSPKAPATDDDATLPDPLDEKVGGLGRIVCISGAQVVADLKLDDEGKPLAKLTKGTLVKLYSDTATTYGIVTGLSIPAPSTNHDVAEIMLAELDLVGECLLDEKGHELPFRRGVSNHPSLDMPIFAANARDFDRVFSSSGKARLSIGTLHEDDSRSAYISADDLLGNHFAILGTTGSGKSCGLTLVLRRTLEAHPKAHMLLLDPHNEYSAAFADCAEAIHPDDLELPYWLMNSEEIIEIIVGPKKNSDLGEEAAAILIELITQSRRSYFKTNMSRTSQQSEQSITVDTPIPYTMRDVLRHIDEVMSRPDKKDIIGPYRWLKSRVETLRSDSRYNFMFGGVTVKDNMAAILSRLFRIPVNDKPLTIVDLSGVPSEVLNVVVSVLARMTFDFGLWSQGKHPILLVCEEAHRYAPADDHLGFEPTKQAIARIAKEGRKYGVSMGIVSQRPAEIAPVILSQCNTLFAFRMNSVRDQQIVRGTLADSAHGLLDFLPALGNAESIVVGEGVPIPQRVRLDNLPKEQRPRSATAEFSAEWSSDTGTEGEVAQVVDAWRRQVR
ncbi:MAG: DUF87 domain-containing protein [Pseudomonadota bacterium]